MTGEIFPYFLRFFSLNTGSSLSLVDCDQGPLRRPNHNLLSSFAYDQPSESTFRLGAWEAPSVQFDTYYLLNTCLIILETLKVSSLLTLTCFTIYQGGSETYIAILNRTGSKNIPAPTSKALHGIFTTRVYLQQIGKALSYRPLHRITPPT